MASQTPQRISLSITSEHRSGTAQLTVTGRAIVGRSSDSGETVPDLDLAPYGGAEGGVSRVHAAFLLDGEQVCIEDLDSTSGTRLNGLPLTPHEQYRLRSQDELEFGRVRVVVRF